MIICLLISVYVQSIGPPSLLTAPSKQASRSASRMRSRPNILHPRERRLSPRFSRLDRGMMQRTITSSTSSRIHRDTNALLTDCIGDECILYFGSSKVRRDVLNRVLAVEATQRTPQRKASPSLCDVTRRVVPNGRCQREPVVGNEGSSTPCTVNSLHGRF